MPYPKYPTEINNYFATMNFDDGRHVGRLISKYLTGTLDEMEQEELNQWRSFSEKNESIFQRMTSLNYLEEVIERYGSNEVNRDAEWLKITEKTIHRKQAFSTKIMRYAAVFIALCVISLGIMKLNTDWKDGKLASDIWDIKPYIGQPTLVLPDGEQIELNSDDATSILEYRNLTLIKVDSLMMSNEEDHPEAMFYHTLKTPKGANHILILSDGTEVNINSDSEIMFPAKFAQNERKVFLKKGEAFFNVTKNESTPFLVDVGPMMVEVLGTTFIVKAYDNEENIQAILASGSIKLHANGETATLVPNTQGSFNRKKGTIDISNADMEKALSWTYNRLKFDNDPLKNILRDLSRTYDFNTNFEGTYVEEIPFSINIRKGESFGSILKLIEATGKVKFKIINNTVFVLEP